MGQEDSLIHNIDRRRRSEALDQGAEYIRRAEDKAKLLLRKPEYSVQAPEFFDLYGKDQVMNDMRDVKRKQDKIKETDSLNSVENAKVAGIFEAIVLEHAELSNWLGQDVTMLKTSLFDDYFNGIDLIAEWQQADREPHVLALAVDVTFGARSVERKLSQIRRDIDRGELGKIKYFKTVDGSFRGERRGSARVVVGVTKGVVKELARHWVTNDKEQLGRHPIQRILVEEIDTQLRAMQKYALSRGRTEVADAYGRSLAIIEKIRVEKSAVSYGNLENNDVFQEIKEQTRLLFPSQ